MPRKANTPYTCPCCGYYTTKKTHMYRHLYELLKPCRQTENELELTDAIKQHILNNRVYKDQTQQPTKKKKRTISHALRVSCWNTYIGEEVGRTTCLCCKSNYITQLNFQCGHVVAEANGGSINIDNLRPICSICNSSMGTINMQEYALNNFNNVI
jgi:hypothetical protein